MTETATRVTSGRDRLAVVGASSCQVHFCNFPAKKKMGDVEIDWSTAYTPSETRSATPGVSLVPVLQTKNQIIELLKQLSAAGSAVGIACRPHHTGPSNHKEYRVLPRGGSLPVSILETLLDDLPQDYFYTVTGFNNTKEMGHELVLQVNKVPPGWVKRDFPKGLTCGAIVVDERGWVNYSVGPSPQR